MILFGVGLVIGFSFFLLIAYGLGGTLSPKLATPIGRVLFTMGSLVNDGTAMEFTGQEYVLSPMKKEGTFWKMFSDGEWVHITDADSYGQVSRVGLRPFGVVCRKNEEVFSDVYYRSLPGDEYDSENYIMPSRASMRAFMPKIWYRRHGDEGHIISLTELMSRLKQAGSTTIGEKSFIEALQRFAISGFDGLSIGFALFCLAALLIGVLGSWLMLG
jgi:hypothetical protein|tara:strand:- start:8807 stop:9454 length:648 start_codon:yes stop_codon:yes gene_type:complete